MVEIIVNENFGKESSEFFGNIENKSFNSSELFKLQMDAEGLVSDYEIDELISSYYENEWEG